MEKSRRKFSEFTQSSYRSYCFPTRVSAVNKHTFPLSISLIPLESHTKCPTTAFHILLQFFCNCYQLTTFTTTIPLGEFTKSAPIFGFLQCNSDNPSKGTLLQVFGDSVVEIYLIPYTQYLTRICILLPVPPLMLRKHFLCKELFSKIFPYFAAG